MKKLFILTLFVLFVFSVSFADLRIGDTKGLGGDVKTIPVKDLDGDFDSYVGKNVVVKGKHIVVFDDGRGLKCIYVSDENDDYISVAVEESTWKDIDHFLIKPGKISGVVSRIRVTEEKYPEAYRPYKSELVGLLVKKTNFEVHGQVGPTYNPPAIGCDHGIGLKGKFSVRYRRVALRVEGNIEHVHKISKTLEANDWESFAFDVSGDFLLYVHRNKRSPFDLYLIGGASWGGYESHWKHGITPWIKNRLISEIGAGIRLKSWKEGFFDPYWKGAFAEIMFRPREKQTENEVKSLIIRTGVNWTGRPPVVQTIINVRIQELYAFHGGRHREIRLGFEWGIMFGW